MSLDQMLDRLDYYESNYGYLSAQEKWEYAELEFNLSIEYNKEEDE